MRGRLSHRLEQLRLRLAQRPVVPRPHQQVHRPRRHILLEPGAELNAGPAEGAVYSGRKRSQLREAAGLRGFGGDRAQPGGQSRRPCVPLRSRRASQSGAAVRLVAHLDGYRDRTQYPDLGDQIMGHGCSILTSAALGHQVVMEGVRRRALEGQPSALVLSTLWLHGIASPPDRGLRSQCDGPRSRTGPATRRVCRCARCPARRAAGRVTAVPPGLRARRFRSRRGRSGPPP